MKPTIYPALVDAWELSGNGSGGRHYVRSLRPTKSVCAIGSMLTNSPARTTCLLTRTTSAALIIKSSSITERQRLK